MAHIASFASPGPVVDGGRGTLHAQHVCSMFARRGNGWGCARTGWVRRGAVRRAVVRASWEDALLPGERTAGAQLAWLHSRFPQTHVHVHVLGVSGATQRAYATCQTAGAGRRAGYATSSRAMPLPLADGAERAWVADACAAAYGTGAGAGAAGRVVGRDASLVGRVLPDGLRRAFGVDAVRANEVAAGMVREEGAVVNRATAGLSALRRAGGRVVGAAVEERAHTGAGARLGGVVFVRRATGSLCGETVYGEVERVECAAATCVGLANAAGVACFVAQELFHATSVAVRDMEGAFAAGGAAEIVEAGGWGGGGGGGGVGGEATRTVVPWEVTAGDALELEDDVLRASVKRCGVGATRGEGREELLRKFVGLMDEVERREVGIALAARNELFGLAAELQRGRSRRGRVAAAVRAAEARGEWAEAARLGALLKHLDAGTADVTAEPGSYSAYLDRDEWYRPSR